MRWVIAIWRNLFHKRAVDQILDEELRSFRQLLEDEKIAAGADSQTAQREAAIELGGIEVIKEQVRDIRRGAFLEGFWTEVRQAIRALRRNPGMTAMCVLMLALGIGASTIIFSVFEAALLRPLPFRDADRLVELVETQLDLGMDEENLSEADFWDLHDRTESFESVGAYNGFQANLTGDGEPEKVSVAQVTLEFFRTLGVRPILGRDFSTGEGNANVAILGNQFWRARYGADANILGKVLRIKGISYTVVGVLPRGEPWIDGQVYLPYPYHPAAERGNREFSAVGRLKKGVTPEAARRELQRLAAVMRADNPKEDKGLGFNIFPSRRWIAPEETGAALSILLVAVGLLVIIACGNVANLLLARGLARRREIALRSALGAARARLVRFVMLESLLLSALGAVVALALAAVSVRGIRTMEIPGIPRLDEVSLNPWVLCFSCGVTVFTGLLCGLAPALQTPLQGVAAALREGDRQTGASRRQGRVRSVLVSAEVALAFLLLVSMGLVLRSFQGLLKEQRGFQTAHRLMFSLSYPDSYRQNGRGKQFIDSLLEELSAHPGVVSSGAVSSRPVEGPDNGMNIDAAKHSAVSGPPPRSSWRVITPGYLRTVGLPLLHGRNFNSTDKPVWDEPGQPMLSHRTVMFSSALAMLLFPNEDPIGKHTILWKGQFNRDAEVVGVVGDSLERGLDHGPALTVYIPYGRVAVPSEFVVDTRGDPKTVFPDVRALIQRLDPNLPIGEVRSFDEVISHSISPQRINSIVLTTFGGFALLLASFGIYGVLSYLVRRRTAEIGLRMALGASEWDILKMIVAQGLLPALLGITLGGAIACWLSRYLKSLLFGVQPIDLLTYAAVSGMLLVTAAFACFVPGHRAMKTDPAIALRLE
ncbi:MAG TPA: ABC transporter permease [Bryobacteraceae bacterium]|nr:ABC transporter permease [Bryobacteraceae bacterium]